MTTLTPFRIHDENRGVDILRSTDKTTKKTPLGHTTGPRKQGLKTGTRKALGDISNRGRGNLVQHNNKLGFSTTRNGEEPLQKPTIPIVLTSTKSTITAPKAVVNLPPDEEMFCTRWAMEDDDLLMRSDSPPPLRFTHHPKNRFEQESTYEFDLQVLKEELDKLTSAAATTNASTSLKLKYSYQEDVTLDFGPLPDLSDLDFGDDNLLF